MSPTDSGREREVSRNAVLEPPELAARRRDFHIQPPVSFSLNGFSVGLALRIALSDRRMGASVPELEGVPPIMPPTFYRLAMEYPGTLWTQKRPEPLILLGLPACFGTLRNCCWCLGRDSNSHGLRHYPLKIACLPISPPRHCIRTPKKSRHRRGRIIDEVLRTSRIFVRTIEKVALTRPGLKLAHRMRPGESGSNRSVFIRFVASPRIEPQRRGTPAPHVLT